MKSIKEITDKLIKGIKNGWERLGEEDTVGSTEVPVEYPDDVKARLSNLELQANPTYRPHMQKTQPNIAQNYKDTRNNETAMPEKAKYNEKQQYERDRNEE